MQERKVSKKMKLSRAIEITSNKAELLIRLNTYNFDLKPDENGNTALHQLALHQFMSDDDTIEIFNYLHKNEYPLDLNAKNIEGKTPLFIAVHKHQFSLAEALVRLGCDIDINLEDDTNILNWLAISQRIYKNDKFSNQVSDIRSLFTALFTRFDINQKDSQGNNLLQQGIISKNNLLTELFLEYGADIANRNLNGFTALDLAAKNDLLDIILLLLSSGAKIENSITFSNKNFNSVDEIFSFALFNSVKENDLDMTSQILEYLSQLNAKTAMDLKYQIINTLNEAGYTVLHIATKKEVKELIKILIDSGADINKYSWKEIYTDVLPGKESPYGNMWPCTYGDGHRRLPFEKLKPIFMIFESEYFSPDLHKDILTIFLSKKEFNINDINMNGSTLLHKYCSMSYAHSLIEFLLKNGADINKPDNNGNTPLHIASHLGKLHYVKLLLSANASVDKCNKNGATPLAEAIRGYKEDRPMLLLAEIRNKQFEIENCKNSLANYCRLIENLLDYGAGIYTGCNAEIPSGVTTDRKLLIGFCIGSKTVNRAMKGYEKAITTIDELLNEIKSDVKLDRAKLIDLCSARLKNMDEIDNHDNLRILRSALYQLTPNSLVNLCLNTLNKPKSIFFRQAGIHKDSELPHHLKQALEPNDDEPDLMQLIA